jgi:hypothetical protein
MEIVDSKGKKSLKIANYACGRGGFGYFPASRLHRALYSYPTRKIASATAVAYVRFASSATFRRSGMFKPVLAVALP